MAGIIVAIDSFGPITDNAGGIAEMADLPEEVQKSDRCTGCGWQHNQSSNQGLCHCFGWLAALVLFSSYSQEILCTGQAIVFDLANPKVLIGLFIGGLLPYLFASFAMQAVGRAAAAVVNEVRRQFKEIKGLWKAQAKPRYGQCVDIVTKAAIKANDFSGFIAGFSSDYGRVSTWAGSIGRFAWSARL